MLYQQEETEKRAAFTVADLMIAAARTAPKACGSDNVVALAIDGKEKDILANRMRDIAKETGADFFRRDAGNVDDSYLVVLIAVKNNPLLLENCSLCGFADCKASKQAQARCALNITDLGIAIGSAVSIAANHRMDNRVMFSAGKAALDMDILPPNISVCYGIPLSTGSKSIFFDRG